jgi:hypothetical protein
VIRRDGRLRKIGNDVRVQGKHALAAVYVALGNADEAFTILNTAITERQNVVAIKVDPPLERLDSDPRWQVLLARMNLPRE